MQAQRARDKFPIFFAYGGSHEFLDTAGAVAATADERIQSIWPFLVRRVKVFQKTLKAREIANFDPEDTISELWVVLKEKNDEWTPERGKYITFAGIIIDRELCAIRDKARTVQSPRNSSCRLKEYDLEVEGGTITSRRMKTANDIRRTSGGIQPIISASGHKADMGHTTTRDPVSLVTASEATEESLDALRVAITRSLDLFESKVVGRLWGLFGRDPKTVFEIAWENGCEPSEIRRVKARALRKIRKYLTDTLHPAIVSRQD